MNGALEIDYRSDGGLRSLNVVREGLKNKTICVKLRLSYKGLFATVNLKNHKYCFLTFAAVVLEVHKGYQSETGETRSFRRTQVPRSGSQRNLRY